MQRTDQCPDIALQVPERLRNILPRVLDRIMERRVVTCCQPVALTLSDNSRWIQNAATWQLATTIAAAWFARNSG
jgi:hypothetical protein